MSKLLQEPQRVLPAAMSVAYVYIVFFSNGILPGPDATQLDVATWEEVSLLVYQSYVRTSSVQ